MDDHTGILRFKLFYLWKSYKKRFRFSIFSVVINNNYRPEWALVSITDSEIAIWWTKKLGARLLQWEYREGWFSIHRLTVYYKGGLQFDVLPLADWRDE